MRTPLDAEPQTLAAAAGLLTGLSVLGIWLLNPYLALLLAPTAHVWLLAARASGPPRTGVLATAAAISLLPARRRRSRRWRPSSTSASPPPGICC